MPTTHAKLSASGAHRWLNCPGSVKLEEAFPDTTSVYAQEGTLAHSMGEIKLQKYFTRGFGPVKFKKAIDEIKKDPLYQKEMDKYTDTYFEEIKRIALSYKTIPFVAIEERVDFSSWVPEGFGTADCILINGDEMVVADLKYGKGVPVSPENNPQLMLYGLGAYNNYGYIYGIKKIRLLIIQPRIDNISSWEISKDDLLKFGSKVKDVAQKAFEGSNDLKEGAHCRFCKAKSRCPERAKVMFNSAEGAIEKKDIKLLSYEEIGGFLKKVEGVIDWIKDLETEALNALLRGEEVPGYKVVEGRSVRKIMDEDGLSKALLAEGYEEVMIYKPRALETITNLERLVGKKNFETLGKPFIEKPQGKPTLVPESDKRDVFKKDVSKMFGKIN